MKPIIGITADFQESGEFRSRIEGEGRYLMREGYVRAVVDAGGAPILLPYSDDPESIVARIDGLLLTGGNFDIPPELSGIKDPTMARKIRPERTQYELALLKTATERDMPVLGICGGMQLMAVAFGGKMIGDIPSEVPGSFDHEQKTPPNQPGHNINIVPGTLLHRLTEVDELGVNSTHHQAVADPGETTICAKSTDGVIEAVEIQGKRFALGVEWHPELLYTTSAAHAAIFKEFIINAVTYQQRKK